MKLLFNSTSDDAELVLEISFQNESQTSDKKLNGNERVLFKAVECRAQ